MFLLLTLRRLRHVLGPVALVLVCAQVLPLALSGACCAGAFSASGASVSAEDCCPAGSHAPGMCPLKHGGQTHAAPSNDLCRLSCAAAASMRLVLPAGVLPLAKPISTPVMTLVVAPAIGPVLVVDIDRVPHAPPPKV